MQGNKNSKAIVYKQQRLIALIIVFIIYVFFRFSSINMPSTRVQTVNDAQVIMYSKTACHYCRQARHFFSKHKITYFEYYIDKSDIAKQHFKQFGGLGTPLIIIDNYRIHGFKQELLTKILKL